MHIRFINANTDYINILEMAQEIVKKLGKDEYDENDYGEYYKGRSYCYDSLYIMEETNKKLEITIEHETVFTYDPKAKSNKYVEGNWKDAIKLIYDQLPALLHQRQIEIDIRKQKLTVMEDIKADLEFYCHCAYLKNNLLQRVHSDLSNYGITVKKVKGHYLRADNINGGSAYEYYDMYAIYYQNEIVAKFLDSTSNAFYSYDKYDYVNDFVLGEWISMFKKVMANARDIEKQQTKEKLKEKSDALLARLSKDFNL